MSNAVKLCQEYKNLFFGQFVAGPPSPRAKESQTLYRSAPMEERLKIQKKKATRGHPQNP
jgi:hypothetical protein